MTNVNLPNEGQIPNLPMGAIVETNAVFTNAKALFDTMIENTKEYLKDYGV